MTEPELTPQEVRQKADESADRVLEGVRGQLGDDLADELHGGVSSWFERWTLPDGSLDLEPAAPRSREADPQATMASFDEWAKQFAKRPDPDE